MEKELKVQPQNSEDRIIFMSMYNDIDLTKDGNQQVCLNNSSCVADHTRNLLEGQWSFVGPGCEEQWYATLAYKPNGAWNQVAEDMMTSFEESGHPVLRGTSSLSRGALKQGQRKAIHHNAEITNCRVITTHSYCRQSAQYLQSSRGFVPGSYSAS